MSKQKPYDITPAGWSQAIPKKQSKALERILTTRIASAIQVSPTKLVVTADTGMKMGVDAVAKICASAIAAPDETEADLLAQLKDLTCGDSSCYLYMPEMGPRGQTTNGGCRCFESTGEDRMRLRQVVRLFKDLLDLRS